MITPSADYLAKQQRLLALIEGKRHYACCELRKEMRREFMAAFELKQSKSRFDSLLTGHGAAPYPMFDHTEGFRRGDAYVIVSHPYPYEQTKLEHWCAENRATLTMANEWAYYYPGWVSLFFVEFTPEMKSALQTRVRKTFVWR